MSRLLTQPTITQNIGKLLCLALVVIILYTYIPERQDTLYYHMIDDTDYQAFVWIRDNIGQEYDSAILDPWKATAFTAITGKRVFTRIHMAPFAKDLKAYDFIRTGSRDTDLLKSYRISIVYTRVFDVGQGRNLDYSSRNPDLTALINNIYLLKEERAP